MRLATLEEVSTVISKGTTPTTLGRAFSSEGIPFIRAEDVIGSSVNANAVAFRISKDTNSVLSRSQLHPGDLLITIAGTLGRVGYVPRNAPLMNCNQAVAFIRLRPEMIDVHFARHACQAGIAELLRLQKIGTIGNLNLEQVRGFTVPLPPLSEQKRIAMMLERADRLRRTRLYALEQSETILPAAFKQMFGDAREAKWNTSTLGELVHDFAYGTSTRCSNNSSLNPVLRIPNIIGGAINKTDLKYGELSPNEKRKLRLEYGDVVFVRTNGNPEYVGRCAVFDLQAELYFASYLIRARVNQNLIMPAFLAAYLRMPAGRASMQPSIRTTAGQYNVSVEGLRDVQVIVPPFPLQETFANLVRRMERMRAVQREALRQAEQFFDSLLHRTFSVVDVVAG